MCILSAMTCCLLCCVDILAQYLPENPHCLELFARNLLPGWTSWGNEVLSCLKCMSFEVQYSTPLAFMCVQNDKTL